MPNDQHETIDAILAEMRDERIVRLDGADTTRCLLLNLADRIEAAVKRERAENEAKVGEMIDFVKREMAKPASPGNAAALREALVKVEKLNHYDLGCIRSEKSRRAIDAKILDIELTIRAALAAPARNCDRFKTLDEAREAFQDLRGHKILADVELWDSMDEAGALVRWLFAPAEGGKE